MKTLFTVLFFSGLSLAVSNSLASASDDLKVYNSSLYVMKLYCAPAKEFSKCPSNFGSSTSVDPSSTGDVGGFTTHVTFTDKTGALVCKLDANGWRTNAWKVPSNTYFTSVHSTAVGTGYTCQVSGKAETGFKVTLNTTQSNT